ncbi:MAG: DUF5652 family protein [Patescibacteria group bacterium]
MYEKESSFTFKKIKMSYEQFLQQNFLWLIIITTVWVLPWKGVALWKAAKNHHQWWFIALLVINTFAILEIIYIFFFSKKKRKCKKSCTE